MNIHLYSLRRNSHSHLLFQDLIQRINYIRSQSTVLDPARFLFDFRASINLCLALEKQLRWNCSSYE